jgi:hypothetical protein
VNRLRVPGFSIRPEADAYLPYWDGVTTVVVDDGGGGTTVVVVVVAGETGSVTVVVRLTVVVDGGGVVTTSSLVQAPKQAAALRVTMKRDSVFMFQIFARASRAGSSQTQGTGRIYGQTKERQVACLWPSDLSPILTPILTSSDLGGPRERSPTCAHLACPRSHPRAVSASSSIAVPRCRASW